MCHGAANVFYEMPYEAEPRVCVPRQSLTGIKLSFRSAKIIFRRQSLGMSKSSFLTF
ncbi:Uncharacterized protein dnm_056450 [Desulfonema magnum]|uniref:Uncharacterized protein n=1 Tax=Desulfonema magnum TaxID=45655 RepID=A0A975BQY9_9BACT|nr:Uncharacterized protein dnm_056450 [Desulfonema magnum]